MPIKPPVGHPECATSAIIFEHPSGDPKSAPRTMTDEFPSPEPDIVPSDDLYFDPRNDSNQHTIKAPRRDTS